MEHADKALFGKTVEEIGAVIAAAGQKPYRARQVWEALYKQRVTSLEEMTVLPAALRGSLSEAGWGVGLPEIAQTAVSVDGTERYLMRMGDGETVETVWMPDGDGGERGDGSEAAEEEAEEVVGAEDALTTPPMSDETAHEWGTQADREWGTQADREWSTREDAGVETGTLNSLASLKPLGQLRDSFILATNEEGLWIVDQHVAHERVLFEKILRERKVEAVQRQRLLMPVLIDLLPEQMVTFAAIAEEMERNGFEAEPFGPRTLAVKAAPVGLEGRELERMLEEVLGVTDRSAQVDNAEARGTRIAASIACHAAIKVNMPLEASKIDWLLRELAKTEHPTSCPHGRPIALRYSLREIQRAFQRI
jgi:DNA mismatch repair ATPase MutL